MYSFTGVSLRLLLNPEPWSPTVHLISYQAGLLKSAGWKWISTARSNNWVMWIDHEPHQHPSDGLWGRRNLILCTFEIKISYHLHMLHLNTSKGEITFQSIAVNGASSNFHPTKMFGLLLKGMWVMLLWIFLVMLLYLSCGKVQHTKKSVSWWDPRLRLLLRLVICWQNSNSWWQNVGKYCWKIYSRVFYSATWDTNCILTLS